MSRASAYIPAQTCSLRLCGAHSAARRGTYVSNRAFYLRLFLISLHAFFSPPFFIMLSHVNPSSSLNAVHFWVHSNVIVCCSSSLFFFFFFLSLTFHCQRFYLGFLFSTVVCLFVCFLFFALADVYCYILSGFFVFLFFFCCGVEECLSFLGAFGDARTTRGNEGF